MVFFKFILFVVVVAAASVHGRRPTHCERHDGDSQFRCGKDDYPADSIRVRNIANAEVSFWASKWISNCGSPAIKHSDKQFSLDPKASVDIEFGEVGAGVCHEMYIYNCKIDGQDRNCLDAVSPTPN